ncbi:Na(+)-translocating NADH-quinone reductase subunit C [Azoarcus communis]|uniref:Na(+)-translocating NADH-quinone reductase subunit C n=1 Tax=Parazoarcus communis SWub3 = DSM 12120 TaxID=1121029 RepID=A0A323UQ48_9RHOO|nr:Na(+)-translocating NADH-quinone reductase subunit C [Parazoarcus communis]NMG48766.1 Na(+)-translocating NADH-quinone reductase subunit C [Parazoarcus communis]NMG71486.1 Na(+)-translocating NADH-quinone reductase subunit C [Parazoarcus communis SWub3 = DSM 12120]PZA15142.1 Na(+)-translocating NADH-quinone reductase subunit C [Azoarcus communis] [Parazoarcus communis SWub3 = DSM 12120]
MSSKKESTGRTLFVALAVSLVSSVFVAGAAVSLKPVQIENRLLDKQRSILSIAGIGGANLSSREVKDLFASRITAKVVDLETGEYSDAYDPITFDPLKAAKDPQLSSALRGSDDIALIKRRERFTTVYMVEQDGKLESLILPVRGYGLWSTLHGFMAVKGDLNTVVGFGFYQHAETPGLGGEVDNPNWKAMWPGKTLFDDSGKPVIQIVKGGVDPASPSAGHQVDALAGATLTSNGVDRLLQFWLGEQGFGPYLAKLRNQGV